MYSKIIKKLVLMMVVAVCFVMVFAISSGAEGAKLEVQSISFPKEIKAGRTINIDVVIKNTGNEEGSGVFRLKVADKGVGSGYITLSPEKSKTITFSRKIVEDPGIYNVSIGNKVESLKVKGFLIAVMPKLIGGVWFNPCQSAGKWFLESRGHKMIIENPEWSSKRQIDIMKVWAGDPEIDGVLLQAVGGGEVHSGIKALVEAGKPIMVFDAEAGYAPEVLLSYAIDYYDLGFVEAEGLAQKLKEKYGTPKGVVIYSVGNMTDANHIAHANGYKDGLAKYPDIEAHEVKAMMDEAISATSCGAKLRSLPKVDALLPQGIEESIGFIHALTREGMKYPIGDPRHVIMCMHDTGGPVNDFLREGFADNVTDAAVTSYIPLIAHYMINYLKYGKSALPKIGDTIRPENVDIATKIPYKELDLSVPTCDWGPTEVVDMTKEYGHPMIRIKVLTLTPETIDTMMIWSNLTKKLEELGLRYPLF